MHPSRISAKKNDAQSLTSFGFYSLLHLGAYFDSVCPKANISKTVVKSFWGLFWRSGYARARVAGIFRNRSKSEFFKIGVMVPIIETGLSPFWEVEMPLTKARAIAYMSHRRESVTAKELSIDLDSRASTASELLERMTAQGLCTRDPKQRPREYALTDAGLERLASFRAQGRASSFGSDYRETIAVRG